MHNSDFPFHELRDDGFFVLSDDGLKRLERFEDFRWLTPGDRKSLTWSPHLDDEIPTLPFPFSNCDLAAFMANGVGSELFAAFNFGAFSPAELRQLRVDEVAPTARRAKTALQDATALLELARIRFPDSIDSQVGWLLDSEVVLAASPGLADDGSVAATAPLIDYTLLADPKELVTAFGSFTGMSVDWFESAQLRDTQKLLKARRFPGKSNGGSKPVPPLFCPLEVMGWLLDRKRRKGAHRLTADKAWNLLETHFPRVYSKYSSADPR